MNIRTPKYLYLILEIVRGVDDASIISCWNSFEWAETECNRLYRVQSSSPTILVYQKIYKIEKVCVG